MYLSNVKVELSNLNQKGVPSDSADAVAVNFKVPDKKTGVIQAYDVVCIGARGSNYSLRVPYSPENKDKVAVLQKRLAKDEIVRVIPDSGSLKIALYAFLGENGNLISGVSVKADTFEISDNNDEEIIV